MDKLRGKFEILIAFVTLVIALSAFKDELAKVSLNLGYTTITLADYLLWIVYGFSICLYFYVVEYIARDTKIGNWKVFDYIIIISYFLFSLILITPIILVLNIGIIKVYPFFVANPKFLEWPIKILTVISISLSLITSVAVTKLRLTLKKIKTIAESESDEIKEMENATKLYNDGYYSHSLLESFKVLETYLYKKLVSKNIRVSRHDFNVIIELAKKHEIITDTDLAPILHLRKMRNMVAHSNTTHSKEEAESVLNLVRNLINRD